MAEAIRYTKDADFENWRTIEDVEADIQRDRVNRINGCKVELARCTDDELYAMAHGIIERVDAAEKEMALIRDELQSRVQLGSLPLEEVA